METLKYILDFQWAHGFGETAQIAFFMSYFAFITLFGLQFKREYIYEGAQDNKLWRDLRLWVLVVMSIQVGLYIYDWSGGMRP